MRKISCLSMLRFKKLSKDINNILQVYQVIFMDYDKIKFILNTSSSFKLLASPHAAFILSFLYIRFKKAEKISIPNAELVEILSDYLEDLRKRQS